ncbi:MAG: Hpt domain-containing protein [Paracoccaceae bacterium]
MLVNGERLAALRGEIGEDGFDEVLEMFLAESDEVVTRLSGQPDGAMSEADLHFLKGSALTLGLEQLAELCRRCEAGPQVHPAVLADLYRQSRAAIRQDQIRNSESTSSLVMSR